MEIKIKTGHIILVDTEDVDRIMAYNWRFGNGVVARYFKRNGKCRSVSIASEISNNLGVQYDHIDNNPLNNQKNNLRVAPQYLNVRNASLRVDSKSKLKGVSWNKAKRKWCAYIQVNYLRIYLGSFLDKFEAARAYDEAAIKHFKEFAHTNF
jgi:hypothetical protein